MTLDELICYAEARARPVAHLVPKAIRRFDRRWTLKATSTGGTIRQRDPDDSANERTVRLTLDEDVTSSPHVLGRDVVGCEHVAIRAELEVHVGSDGAIRMVVARTSLHALFRGMARASAIWLVISSCGRGEPVPGPTAEPAPGRSAAEACASVLDLCTDAPVQTCAELNSAPPTGGVRLRLSEAEVSLDASLVCGGTVSLLWFQRRPSTSDPLSCAGRTCSVTLCGETDPSFRRRVTGELLVTVCDRSEAAVSQ